MLASEVFPLGSGISFLGVGGSPTVGPVSLDKTTLGFVTPTLFLSPHAPMDSMV